MIGAWRLVRFWVESPAGTRWPFGEDAEGLIVYSADGWMSAILSRHHEATEAALERSHHLDRAAKADAFDGYLSYAGRWRVEGDEVVHAIELSLVPGLRTEQRRRFVLDGDTLALSYTMQGRSGVHTFHLHWRRA